MFFIIPLLLASISSVGTPAVLLVDVAIFIRCVASSTSVAASSALNIHHRMSEGGERSCQHTDLTLHAAHLGVLAILC